jgi:hypothetical protein
MALTWTTSSGGKNPRATGARLLVKSRKALLEEPLSPLPDDLPSHIQANRDLIGGQPLGRQ